MIRVIGDVELYVGVDWPARTVRVYGPAKESLLWLTQTASVALRTELKAAESQIEHSTVVFRGEGYLNVDLPNGHIYFEGVDAPGFTVVESEHLRYLLARAESALATGVGDIGL